MSEKEKERNPNRQRERETGIFSIMGFSKNYSAAYYQNLEEVPGPLVPEKIQKHEKTANTLKNCLNSWY